MIKVLIADDEQKVAQLIRDLIDWESLGMVVMGLAKNGNEALELIEREMPDIVITDIRMPGCGGIELIERAKEISPALDFIIISGYRHFDYAHSAIKYGVSDYLLKPINEADLKSTLLKMRWNHENRVSQRNQHRLMEQQIEEGLRVKRLELFRLLAGPINREQLTVPHLNNNFGYHFQTGCFRVVLLKIDGAYDEIYSDGLPIYREKSESLFRNALSPLCYDLSCAFAGTTTFFVVNYGTEHREEIPAVLRDVFDDIRIQNSIFLSASFTMAAGRESDGPEGLAESRAYAERLLSERLLLGAGTFYISLPEKAVATGLTALLAEAARTLEKAVEVMDVQGMGETIDRVMKNLLEKDDLTGKDVIFMTEMILNNYVMLCQRYEFDLPDEAAFRADFAKREAIIPSAEALAALLRETVTTSFQGILKRRGEINARPIMNAKQYIRNHFAEPLSLDDIAAKEGFNASYFSTLFKKETGKTFSEELHDVRMEEAKALLRDTDLSIAVICERVGYLDIKHFSASFKRATGIKPSAFRKLYSWRDA